MEARKVRQQQMSGSAIINIMRPSMGLRDDILRRGGTPKDHMKENRRHLKELQQRNEQLKKDTQKPPKDLFKLKEFENIPPRICTTPSRTSTPSTTSKRKNFIKSNIKSCSVTPSRSVSPISEQYKLGMIPKYLIERKLEWAEREQQRLMQIEKEKVPAGHKLLPDEERIRTLNALKLEKHEAMLEIERMPLVIETRFMKQKMKSLEEKIKETEEGIRLFSRSRVYIPTESSV